MPKRRVGRLLLHELCVGVDIDGGVRSNQGKLIVHVHAFDWGAQAIVWDYGYGDYSACFFHSSFARDQRGY